MDTLFDDLATDIYRERVMRARACSPGSKMLDGPRLSEYACELARSGIRRQFPGFDEAGVQAELKRRLALADRLQD